jgi:hypothetical protein
MNRPALGWLLGAACSITNGAAMAADIACDSFNAPSYTIGSDVYPAGGTGPADGLGWTSGWQGSSGYNITAPRTVVAGLSYPGLVSRKFAAASPAYVGAGTNSTAVRGFTNTATNVLWFSFLIQLNSAAVMANGNSAGNYGGIALEDASGSHFLYVGVPGGATGYSLQTNPTIAKHGSAAPAVGRTDLLVVRIDAAQKAVLWVNPTLGQPLGAPAAFIKLPLPASDYVNLYWSDSWGWTYGDVRIGDTLASVTPRRRICPT